MTSSSSPQERFQALLRADTRFKPEAYNFIFEALDHTVREKYGEGEEDTASASRHVTGPDLLEGIRDLAIESFGCLASTVLDCWGIGQSDDFGELVFNLVEYGLMGSQESDSKEDFSDGYGGLPLADVFYVRPTLDYDPERDEWTASYESAVYG
ncbi:MAG: Minf_1886 family protein [Planctomycetota bacterium]